MESYDVDTRDFDLQESNLRQLEDIVARHRFGMADRVDQAMLTKMATEQFQMTPVAQAVSMEVAPALLLLGKIALGGALLTLLIAGIRKLLGMGQPMSSGGGRMAKIWTEYENLEKEMEGKVTPEMLAKLKQQGLEAMKKVNEKHDKAKEASLEFFKALAGGDLANIDQSKIDAAIKQLQSGTDMTSMLKVLYLLLPKDGDGHKLFNEYTVNGPATTDVANLEYMPKFLDACINYLDHCENSIFSKPSDQPLPQADIAYIEAYPFKSYYDKWPNYDEVLQQYYEKALQPVEMKDADFDKVAKHIREVNQPNSFYQKQKELSETMEKADYSTRLQQLKEAFDRSNKSDANSQSAASPNPDYARAANAFGQNVAKIKSVIMSLTMRAGKYMQGAQTWIKLAEMCRKALSALHQFVRAGNAVSTASRDSEWMFSTEDFDGVNEGGGFDLDDAADDNLPEVIDSQDIFKQVDATGDEFSFYDDVSEAMLRGPIMTEESFRHYQERAREFGYTLKPQYRRTLLARSIATESLGLGMILGGIGLVGALSGLAYFLWKKFSGKDDGGKAAEAMSDGVAKATESLEKAREETAQLKKRGYNPDYAKKHFEALQPEMTDDQAKKERMRKEIELYQNILDYLEQLSGNKELTDDMLDQVFNVITEEKNTTLTDVIVRVAQVSPGDGGALSWAASTIVNKYGDRVFTPAAAAEIATSFRNAFVTVLKSTNVCTDVAKELSKLDPAKMQASADSEWEQIKRLISNIPGYSEGVSPDKIGVLSDGERNSVGKVLGWISDSGAELPLTTKEEFDAAKKWIELAGQPTKNINKANIEHFIAFMEEPKNLTNLLYIQVGNEGDKLAEQLEKRRKEFEEAVNAVKGKLEAIAEDEKFAALKHHLRDAAAVLSAYAHSARDFISLMSAWMMMVRKLSAGTARSAALVTKISNGLASLSKVQAAGGNGNGGQSAPQPAGPTPAQPQGQTPADPNQTPDPAAGPGPDQASYNFYDLPMPRGFNLEAFNQVDFNEIPEHEYPEYMDALDDEIKLMNSDAVHVQELHDYLDRNGLVSKQNIVELEHYFPGLVTRKMPLAAFTDFPSKTNYRLALEESGMAATAAKGAAVVALAAVAVKMTVWLVQRFQMSRNAAMAIGNMGDEIRQRLEKLKDARGTFVVRYNGLSDQGRSEMATKLNDHVTKAGGTFSADQHGDGDAVATELIKAVIQGALKSHYNGLVADLTHDGRPLNKSLQPLTEVIVKNVAALTNNARKVLNDAKSQNPPPVNPSVIPDWHLQPLVSACGAKANTPEALAAELKTIVETEKNETANPQPSLESLTTDDIGKMFESAVRLAKATTPDVDKRMTELSKSLGQMEKANSTNLAGQSAAVKAALDTVKADMKIITDFQAIHTGILATTKTFMEDLLKGLKSVDKAFGMTVKDKPKKEGEA